MSTDLMKDYYTEDEVATFLGLTFRTLRNRRYAGVDHPPCRIFGRLAKYPKKEFQQWVESRPLHKQLRVG